MANDRIPPQNIEAEMSVLGALMLSYDGMTRVADILRSQDFYKPTHQEIFDSMLELYARSEPIDVVSVTNRLNEKGTLETVGGSTYVTTLVNSVPTASNIVYYADIVRRKKVLRDLIDASYHIGELGFHEEENIEALLDSAEQKIFQISQHSLKQKFLKLKDTLVEAWDRLESLHKGGDAILRGVSTGFKDLDFLLAGLQKSDLIILAARPSLGKTSLALNIAQNVALHSKVPVGLFSLEMSKEQLVDRILASESHINLWNLRNGKLYDGEGANDFMRIRDAMDRLSEAPIFIDDAASSTVLQIRTMARRLKAEQKGLGLIVIDYLQLIQTPGRSESRVQEVSEISRSLKGLARELDVPILALSQLSRAVESRTDMIPKLSDLRESGSIEQDADVVMFIYREDKVKKNTERKNIAEIHVAKHRNGPTGIVELYFNEEHVSFRTIDRNFPATEAPPEASAYPF
ncbi:MAG: replicative DNA helicase [Patescibacteria group bacterium]